MSEATADELERRLSHLVAVACAARQHPDAWQAIRRAWLPGAPATATYLGQAAHPAEFREVLVALHAAYAARLPPETHGESEAMRDFRRGRMADLVRDETTAYIKRVTPKTDLRSLFAQAADGGGPPPTAARARPTVTVRTCRRCGAAREAGTIYGHCGFCGTAFFPQPG
ncbi:MAG TPA: hypothetical protein VHU92_21370 [Streptosporangiaceae bacterium]|nr:hypothetical protein [Streptosporangiaceae bacterium]